MNFKVDLDKKPERFRDHRPGIRLAVVNKSTEIFGKKLTIFFIRPSVLELLPKKEQNLTRPKAT